MFNLRTFSQLLANVFKNLIVVFEYRNVYKFCESRMYIIKHVFYILLIQTKKNEQTKLTLKFSKKKSFIYLLGDETSTHVNFMQPMLIVGEPKSRFVQKHTFFAPEKYTAGILYTDSLNSA